MSNIAKEVATTGAIGVAAGASTVGSILVSQSVAAAAIPTLMSCGSTVVAGVGSIMPFWIGPIQAFAVAGTVSIAFVPAVAVAGVAAGGYGLYRALS